MEKGQALRLHELVSHYCISLGQPAFGGAYTYSSGGCFPGHVLAESRFPALRERFGQKRRNPCLSDSSELCGGDFLERIKHALHGQMG